MDWAKYHPFYCEENAWQLCGAPAVVASRSSSVVFVSNEISQVLLWEQRAADRGAPVVWDYHVFVIAGADTWQVWDPDTRLGIPTDLQEYFDRTFATVGRQPPQLDPAFRLVDASEYRSTLCSDRGHMRSATGEWLQPPPPWPPIGAVDAAPNLHRFRDMKDPFIGERFDLAGLLARFRGPALG